MNLITGSYSSKYQGAVELCVGHAGNNITVSNLYRRTAVFFADAVASINHPPPIATYLVPLRPASSFTGRPSVEPLAAGDLSMQS